MRKILTKGRNLFFSESTSILSAASIIMSMIILSQIFGFVRQWVILRYLGKESFSLFLAGFRMPDLIFEVFAFGVFSAAFIPVFTKYLKRSKKEAWEVAGRAINIGLIFFGVFSIIFSIFAYQFYTIVAHGFSAEDTATVASVARILLLAQGFFIVSYLVTGVLESLRRFLVPALAPIFYNLGIILGTVLLSDRFGIMAPAIGAVFGALMHLGIQLPFAYKLGLRFTRHVKPDEGVKEIGKLAAPRFIELIFLQILKSIELFFASLLPTASYGFLLLANSLQSLPTTLFAVSLSKVAMVSLSRQDEDDRFKKIFENSLNQIMFFILPAAAFFIVLRVPIVRLVYGTSQSLDWESTIAISSVLSAFAIGIPFQSALALLSRAFYARRNTRIPVILSIIDVVITVILEVVMILILHLPVYAIALANSLSVFVQVSLLYYLLGKKLNGGKFFSLIPILKTLAGSTVAGLSVYFLLKFFDRSVWVKRLSFINGNLAGNLPFEKFVLDTRYTPNLIILTVISAVIGLAIYFLVLFILRSQELSVFIRIIKTRSFAATTGGRLTQKEPVSTPESDF